MLEIALPPTFLVNPTELTPKHIDANVHNSQIENRLI